MGRGHPRAVVVEDNEAFERSEVPMRRLLVFIGAEPTWRGSATQLEPDDGGYILTGRADGLRPPQTLPPGRPSPLTTIAAADQASRVNDVQRPDRRAPGHQHSTGTSAPPIASDELLVEVAPAPVLARLEGLHDRTALGVSVGAGMTVGDESQHPTCRS